MEDVSLVWMMPHMHLRGKDMKYKLIFPDGREQVVFNVPHYDFNGSSDMTSTRSTYRKAQS